MDGVAFHLQSIPVTWWNNNVNHRFTRMIPHDRGPCNQFPGHQRCRRHVLEDVLGVGGSYWQVSHEGF